MSKRLKQLADDIEQAMNAKASPLVLINQLCALERRPLRGGRDAIDHPPGGHDDVANAAMGALVRASAGSVFQMLTRQEREELAREHDALELADPLSGY